MAQRETTAAAKAATSLEKALILSDLRAQYPQLPWTQLVPRILARWAKGAGEAASAEEEQAEKLLTASLERYGRTLAPAAPVPAVAVPALDEVPFERRRMVAFAHAVLDSNSAAYDEAVTAGAIAPDDDRVAVIKWPTREQEYDGVAVLVRRLMASDESFVPQDFYLAVADEATAQAVQDALYHHRLESTVALETDPLSGDPRTPTAAMEAVTRLTLAADPDDLLAWRVWCALGQRGLATRPWLAFLAWVEENELSYGEALSLLTEAADEPFESATAVADALAQGRAFAAAATQLRGLSLLRACNPGGDRVFARLAGRVESDATPQELLERVEASARRQRFEDIPSAVRVGSLGQLPGLAPRIVIVVGAVEGAWPRAGALDASVPEHRREALIAQDRRRFAAALAEPRERVIVSLFSEMPEDEVRQSGCAVARVTPRNGVPMARLKPTRFIAEAQNAAPGTQSAEQFVR